MTLIAFETSCDETSVAVVRDGVVLANQVASQIQLHGEYGGVVPELAAREHLNNLLPVARAANLLGQHPAPGAGRHYGLIAQELASTLGTNTRAALVSVDSTGLYGIAYSQLIAPMIRSTQELHAEIVALKARVAQLEGVR